MQRAHKLSLLGVFACLMLGACIPQARADFLYNDFSSTSGLKLNGNAAQVGNVLRLSNATSFSSGSAFTTAQVSLGSGNSFSTFFQFQIGNPGGIGDSDGVGADGLVFVVQTVSNNVGTAGFGIGYAGITPSLGIEFDTYDNGSSTGDPNGNHVGIDLNGNIVSVQTQTEPTRFNNGAMWSAWTDYDGATDKLEVRWSQDTIRPTNAQLSRTVDLNALLGQDTAYVGFTSATGSGWGNHDLLHWEFRGAFAPVGVAAVPEPSSLILAGLGGFGVLIGARFRRLYRHRRTGSGIPE